MNTVKSKNMTFLILVLCFFRSILSAESSTFTIDNHELVLNGTGTRKVAIFNVYEGKLYLKSKSKEASKVVSMDNPKVITMKFLRYLKAKKVADGFTKAFKNSNANSFEKFKKTLSLFNSKLPDFRNKDLMTLIFTDSGLKVKTEKSEFEIKDKDFSNELFKIWFITPLDENLMKGLLGL